MKKTGCSRWGLWIGLFAVILLCIVGVALLYFQVRIKALNSRPLVLIHSPIYHEQFAPGEGVLVHATARSERGVSRVELWADGTLLSVQEGPQGGPLSPLVLTADWQAASLGSHVLLVRAISADGVEGQATVAVEVLGEEEVALGGHFVQAGETLESIAEQYGVSSEEVAALNPDVDPGGIAPGEELIVPGGSGEGELPTEDGGEPAPVAGDEGSPDPLAPAPGSGLTILEFFFPDLDDLWASADPVPLRVEVLSLETGVTYERLHCYVGLAGDSPRWVPDADFDQTTDESFAALGGGLWNVGEHLSGEAAPIVAWPGNQPITISASCVGILGGGTDAVDLGQLLLEVPPIEWDGVARWSPEASNEGSFRLEYRIRPSTEQGHGIPVWLDPSMTPPTNLTLAGFWAAGYNLYWSYEPRPDEEPIDGFRIYLNGTLLWVEPPDARTTVLPSQWLFPCVEPYTFTVTAFREGYPDGPESMPAAPPVIIEAEPEHCQRVVYVTFLNLTTHNLGSDGRYEDRSGDVGPAYGYFYANDQQVGFDGRGGNFTSLGLSHNSVYGIRDLLWDWNRSGPSQFRVELAEEELLEVGFHIDNEDTGRCHDSDDPGCDNLICEGEARMDVDVTTTSDEGTIVSSDGRCGYPIPLASGCFCRRLWRRDPPALAERGGPDLG
jgi:LysM repeat protein